MQINDIPYDNPIKIISMVGASRQGKSSYINILISYLFGNNEKVFDVGNTNQKQIIDKLNIKYLQSCSDYKNAQEKMENYINEVNLDKCLEIFDKIFDIEQDYDDNIEELKSELIKCLKNDIKWNKTVITDFYWKENRINLEMDKKLVSRKIVEKNMKNLLENYNNKINLIFENEKDNKLLEYYSQKVKSKLEEIQITEEIIKIEPPVIDYEDEITYYYILDHKIYHVKKEIT